MTDEQLDKDLAEAVRNLREVSCAKIRRLQGIRDDCARDLLDALERGDLTHYFLKGSLRRIEILATEIAHLRDRVRHLNGPKTLDPLNGLLAEDPDSDDREDPS